MEWLMTPENIRNVAEEFWKVVPGNPVLAFHGQMGAGKTTFIHALCDAKGVGDVVGSPTFSLINEYQYDCEGTRRILFHMDLYRLKSEEEARQAGIEDCLYSGYTCLVEWPEKAPSLFPEHTIHVQIEWVNDQTRTVKIADK